MSDQPPFMHAAAKNEFHGALLSARNRTKPRPASPEEELLMSPDEYDDDAEADAPPLKANSLRSAPAPLKYGKASWPGSP
ncbi:MAG: hypothetical protein ACO3IB_08630 [Phycisphaerales bacterium]